MKIDVYTATGTKNGSVELPASLFEAPINKGLMHLALVRQQSNRRHSIAHVKHRGEVVGSTKKMFQQKGTGRARRGPLRSPLLRGGGKAFGPRNESNFFKGMPKKMRRAALFSCLSMKAQEGVVLGLENYPDTVKTKQFLGMLKKMPVELGRRIVIVLAERHRGIEMSARNIPRVKTIFAQYLNPEDVLGSNHIIFLVDALKVAEETFVKADTRTEKKVTRMTEEAANVKPFVKKMMIRKSPAMKKADAEAKKTPRIRSKKATVAKVPKAAKAAKSPKSA